MAALSIVRDARIVKNYRKPTTGSFGVARFVFQDRAESDEPGSSPR